MSDLPFASKFSILPLAVEWARKLPMSVDFDQDVRLAAVKLHSSSAELEREMTTEGAKLGRLVMRAYAEHVEESQRREGRRSLFFGRPNDGKVADLTLRLVRLRAMAGEWGRRTYFWFRHPDDGRLVRYLNASGRAPELTIGEVYRVRGVVKEHLNGSQVPEPTTVLTRCSIEPAG